VQQRPSNLLMQMLRALPHSHGINDPGHAHSIYLDPGHSHTVNDPGHSHSLFNDGAMLETKLIDAMASNLIASPQRLSNSLYYRMRVTGTGAVWRDTTGNTFRPPGEYINAEFIQRSIGLPIVVEHPEEGVLTTETRQVGNTVFAYVPDNAPGEVWAIGRITDGQTQDDLLSEKLSTSPSVITAPASTEGEEGRPVYILQSLGLVCGTTMAHPQVSIRMCCFLKMVRNLTVHQFLLSIHSL
jgi:hypothetical protein